MNQLELGLSGKKELNSYEQKQLEKAERYESRAKKAKTQSDSTLNQVRREREYIPLGQPILVGHHSEKRHRNHLAKLENRERRGWEESKKSEYYDDKAERIRRNIETDAVISSDDPDAVSKLQAKLVKLEEKREAIKEFNKKARKEGTEQAPAYLLKNLAGNIKSVKTRIQNLEAYANIDDTDQVVKGVRIEKDKDDNRIRLIFPGKPEAEVRSMLKSHGFRWSPHAGAWQRQLNGAGLYAVERFFHNYTE